MAYRNPSTAKEILQLRREIEALRDSMRPPVRWVEVIVDLGEDKSAEIARSLDYDLPNSSGSIAMLLANASSFVHRKNAGNVGIGFRLPSVDVSHRLLICVYDLEGMV